MVQHLGAKNQVHGAVGKRQPVGVHAGAMDLLQLPGQPGERATLLQAFHGHISSQHNRPPTRHFNGVTAAAAAYIQHHLRSTIAQEIERIDFTYAQRFRQQHRKVILLPIDTLVEFLLLAH